MMDFKALGDAGEGFACFETALTGPTAEEFIEQFRGVCSCNDAKQNTGIVYIWFTEKAIPRLRGASDIVDIGQTKNSFFARHHRYAAVMGSSLNWERYKHIISQFGPIKIAFKVVPEPRVTETELIGKYFERHLELPPVNASK